MVLRRRTPLAAVTAAFLLTFVQFAGLLHFHNPASERPAAQTLVNADQGCPVCAIALHASAAAAPAHPFAAPILQLESLRPLTSGEFSRISAADNFGRAPPASL
jgi:hypothetical protein